MNKSYEISMPVEKVQALVEQALAGEGVLQPVLNPYNHTAHGVFPQVGYAWVSWRAKAEDLTMVSIQAPKESGVDDAYKLFFESEKEGEPVQEPVKESEPVQKDAVVQEVEPIPEVVVIQELEPIQKETVVEEAESVSEPASMQEVESAQKAEPVQEEQPVPETAPVQEPEAVQTEEPVAEVEAKPKKSKAKSVKKKTQKENEKPDNSALSIEVIGLKGKAAKSFEEGSGCKTLGDVAKLSIEELSAIPGVGAKTIEKIVESMKGYGFILK